MRAGHQASGFTLLELLVVGVIPQAIGLGINPNGGFAAPHVALDQ